ncbi:MAG: hypothetical protein IKN52_18205, partial [Victivallales bacterium]|nr:hypothetical protein [Victivallales bacterium]
MEGRDLPHGCFFHGGRAGFALFSSWAKWIYAVAVIYFFHDDRQREAPSHEGVLSKGICPGVFEDDE